MVPPPIGRKNIDEDNFAASYHTGFNGAAPNRAEEQQGAYPMDLDLLRFNGAAPNRAEELPGTQP